MIHFAFVDRSFDELTSPTIIDDSVRLGLKITGKGSGSEV